MWCLARLLPLMIGELVPQNDPYWQNFVLLLTITDYIFAPVTSDDIASYVKVLLKEHHKCFCEFYPSAPVIPKMHYMLHLPEWMKRYVECLCDKYISLMQHRFGPPSRFWCMRFEAKHGYFKNLTRVIRNFKNIPKTLAERHQARMCYELSQPNPFKNHLYGRVRYGYMYTF